MGRRGRERVLEQFTWEACARRCLDAYQEIGAPPRRNRQARPRRIIGLPRPGHPSMSPRSRNKRRGGGEADRTAGLGREMLRRARELLFEGPSGLDELPPPAEVAAMGEAERHAALQPLRVELYALASIVADDAVQRALDARTLYPPYGLVRSLFTELGVMLAAPEPREEGSIDSFFTLGKALIDTTVFHLHRHIEEFRRSDRGWMNDRLGRLLALFRLDASPAMRARMRDTLSFVYGGLQFGTSTCVQLAEVMTRLLESTAMPAHERAAVLRRSGLPAYQLAAVNVDHVVAAYRSLQPPSAPQHPGEPPAAGWMDPERFVMQYSTGAPWKIGLRHEVLAGLAATGGEPEEPTMWPTQGCPARISPRGGSSPITKLWGWTADLAGQTGLLEAPGAPPAREAAGEQG
jgi:hypothetical protein